ncbi:MAG TPA: diaminopimelate decarboxylase [Burkholderiales bacterium]|nr:diaminopimelate decarboxylase [Burkholderiales bacterium]
MSFAYHNGVLCAEKVSLEDIVRRHGTPCYVYSGAAIAIAYAEFSAALRNREALVCYSVKANSNLAVLALLARLGAGFDIVSGGELMRVLAAGGDPGKTVFSGVGKTQEEIALALEKGVRCINLESEGELERVAEAARRSGRRAPVAFRVNPDIDARTHPYISTGLRESKFGVPYQDALRLYTRAAAMPAVDVQGIGCHIGSQLTAAAPFAEATGRIAVLADRIHASGIALKHIDIGGGMGIRYRDDELQEPIGSFLDGALGVLAGRPETLLVDPGRSIVGNAGVLITRVEYVKSGAARNFLVVDAAMNDLLRPALYGAWHEVRPVRKLEQGAQPAVYDVVGPVCESGDFLARDRLLAARPGDLLAVMSAGAYGMVMSSNYNTRPRAAEVLVSNGEARLVRRRESIESMLALEDVPA